MKSSAEILKEHSLKVTKSRLAILDFLLSKHIPVSLKDIHEHTGSSADFATVYRTIKELEVKHIVKSIPLQYGLSVYELILGRHHHHHITCTKCATIEDITDCHVDSLSSSIVKNSTLFNRITDHSLEFYGVCKKCAQ